MKKRLFRVTRIVVLVAVPYLLTVLVEAIWSLSSTAAIAVDLCLLLGIMLGYLLGMLDQERSKA